MKNTDTVTLSPEMRAILELDEDPIAGNVMARAINVTFGGGFTGMEYGWADEDEDALAFVVDLVTEVDERPDPDTLHELADAAVPIYTETIWTVAKRLRDLVDEDDVAGLTDGGDQDLTHLLQVGLYTVASRLADHLAAALDD